ncbi:MAG: response regulator transcription factor [Synergistaceae bacterium]|nr:response regulator transcription factor [Synergistaceae bacterium]
MSEKKPLILIVEDDVEMANLNARFLERKGYDVLVAYTAAEARSKNLNNEPDVYVLDIILPDGDGLSLCKEFRKNTEAQFMFLTGKTQINDRITGLETGGDYYMTKPYDRNEFLAVIQCLLRRADRERKMVAEVAEIEKGPLTLQILEGRAYIDGRDADLTQKEFAVLLLLAQNEGKELSGEFIYKNVWKSEMIIDTGLVRKAISQIKKKLDADEIDDFSIHTRYGGGYTFQNENDF